MDQLRYTVGQVSELTGIPKDTLLYYDRIDLFKPSQVNPKTKYRYYTHDQFWMLDIIHCCRNLDIPLETIRAILATKDNKKIVSILNEYRERAQELSNYYAKVARDIQWYEKQYELVREAPESTPISIQQLPLRRVVYGENEDHLWDYHSRFLKNAKEAFKRKDSFRRESGFVMDPEGIKLNNFMKKGEYAEFEAEAMDALGDECCRTFPAGSYACCTVTVVHRQVDFSLLNAWLEEHNIKPELVLVEEVGFQMSDYFGQGYPCQVMVKVPDELESD